jgi:uncharacterized membrane protein YfcA
MSDLLESLPQTALLVGSAFLAGAVNTLAGGGTLLTFPSLVRFGHLDMVMANGTSTVALVPGSLAGGIGYRHELGRAGPWFALLVGPSLVGGVTGALLVTRLPSSVFAALVPWLLLTASLLFLAQPRLLRLFAPARVLRIEDRGSRIEDRELKEPATSALTVVDEGGGNRSSILDPRSSLPSWPLCSVLVFFHFLVSVYGGYFGAGIGILMITSLGLMGLGDIHRINAVKTLLNVCINGVSVVVFVIEQKVEWRFAPPMAVGSILGGYAAAILGRRLPKEVVRWFVILVGLGLSAYYFAR